MHHDRIHDLRIKLSDFSLREADNIRISFVESAWYVLNVTSCGSSFDHESGNLDLLTASLLNLRWRDDVWVAALEFRREKGEG